MEWLSFIAQIIGIYAALLSIIASSFVERKFPLSRIRLSLRYTVILVTALLASTSVTSFVMGVMQPTGMLESSELKVFDEMMQFRPDEGKAPRLLIIIVTPEDIEYQDKKKMERGAKSLSDQALAKVLEKLNQHQPRVIGLDIFRDFPAKYPDLETQLKDNDRLIATCFVDPVIAPPPEIQEEKRLGFSDLLEDSDGVIRRQLLGMATPRGSRCPEYSLSLRVALRYLKEEGISSKFISEDKLQIGKTIFHKIEFDAGGYRLSRSESQGFQILLNYHSADPIARQITLKQFLDGSIDCELPELVKKRIILIGTNAPSVAYRDLHLTPYSMEMPGITIHAHMIGQIISAVLDGRPRLWWWPQTLETLWVGFWSLVVGILVGHWRSPLSRQLVVGGALIILYVICYLVFWLMGGWLPIIPLTLSLIITGLIVVPFLLNLVVMLLTVSRNWHQQ